MASSGGMFKASDLFDFPESLPFSNFFRPDSAPWEWLPSIKEALAGFDFPERATDLPAGLAVSGDVFIHPSVQLPAFGSIQGPTYIGEGCELRPGVFIRGFVITGKGCVWATPVSSKTVYCSTACKCHISATWATVCSVMQRIWGRV